MKLKGGSMFKKIVFFFLVCLLGAFVSFAQENKDQPAIAPAVAPVAAPAAADQENKDTIVKGTVKEIAKDGSYIMIDATKINTTKEFLEDAYLEVGDKVEITAKQDKDGLSAVDYNYIFDEEQDAAPAKEELPVVDAAPVTAPAAK
jgi:hypothetical protein